MDKTAGQAKLFLEPSLYRSGLVRSRILLRNLSRENEGLAVECSASNSDRTTGRTGLKTGQNPRQDRTKDSTGQDQIPGRTGSDPRQDRISGRTGSQVGQSPPHRTGSQAGQNPRQDRTTGRRGTKTAHDLWQNRTPGRLTP